MTDIDTPITPLDLLRRLENLLRPGTVQAVDHTAARVRIASGDLLTDWLPWVERRAGTSSTWSPPTVGEQCLLLCPGGEMAAGLVLVGLYSDSHPAPVDDPDLHRTVYADGAVIEYDQAAHTLRATLPAGATVNITAPGGITLDTPTVTVTGDVVASGISLVNHIHGGVRAGGETSGAPQ